MQCSNCHSVLSEGVRQCPTCGLTFVVQNEGVPQAQAPMNGSPTGNPYAPQQAQYPYGMPQVPQVPNNLVWAILSTVFCCLPTGIYAIIQAAKVDGLVAQGRIQEARVASCSARNWSIYGVLANVLFLLGYGLLVGIGGIIGS